jgi:TPR repeat protein
MDLAAGRDKRRFEAASAQVWSDRPAHRPPGGGRGYDRERLTHINVATDPNSALVLRSEESDRINDLMVHGHKMVEVGYLAGARAYFKRAAEAGSAAAALALGDTYDRVFIDSIGAHGIKADLAQARTWYERARELGSEEAKAKLERLKKADDAQLTSVESAPSNGEPHGSPHTKVRASVDGAQKAGETGTQK